MNSNKQTILWAVNPNKNPKDARELIKEMKIWAEKINCEIQPVAVFSKLKIGFPAQMSLLWENSFEAFAKASLKKYLKKLPTSGFLEPKIIFSDTLSIRRMASDLATYAEKTKASLIFTGTRMKNTNTPISLGGFAESLISLSQTPVLLMNPDVVSNTKKNSILFPTNLSSASEKALSTIKPWVSTLHSKIVLLNQIEIQDAYTYEFQTSKVLNNLKETKSLRLQALQNISNELAKDDIKAKSIVVRSHSPLGAEVLEVARKNKVELIVVTNSPGSLLQNILDSEAREIVTRAKCPVLVLNHSHETKAIGPVKTLPKSQQVQSEKNETVLTA